MPYHKVATLNDLWDGEMIARESEGRKLLVAMYEGKVHAYEDRCAHQGSPLSLGRLEGNLLTCSVHHWQYNICNGHGVNPATARLREFPVRIYNRDILVDTGSG